VSMRRGESAGHASRGGPAVQDPTFLDRSSVPAPSLCVPVQDGYLSFTSSDLLRNFRPLSSTERKGSAMLKNILVPLDGSPLAEAALPYARAIASRAEASLVLVRAAHRSSVSADVAIDQLRAISQAEGYLTLLADSLKAHGFIVQTGVPFGGAPADWIVEETELRHIDLIVMATHDRIGPDR